MEVKEVVKEDKNSGYKQLLNEKTLLNRLSILDEDE